ncbi:MAG: hypothetical protein IJY73_05120 [Oscillospiraceae bacterium]|nr:hypothetical protein [Oscillospiraceae bacterium]
MKNLLKSTALILSCLTLASCSGDAYGSYAAAYKKVSANGGMCAEFDLTLEMDGVKTETEGKFSLDTSDGKNILYYEMEVDGSEIIQFSDGEYLYTDTDGHKIKYALNSKPSASSDKEEVAQKNDSDSVFDTEQFLNEFSSFLEAGKIKELGLLSPIEKAAVTDVSVENNVYTLSFSDKLVQKYLNIMIANETQSTDGDTLNIDELKNFKYTATVTGDIVTDVVYSGVITVEVPASLMASGEAASYEMDLEIAITFVNPGEAVEVEIPSTDGYQEV